MAAVTGADRLRRDATILREALVKELRRQVKDSTDKPLGKLRRAVDAQIAEDFPKCYAGVYGAAFRIKVATSTGSSLLRVKLTGTAKGKSQIRDSAALNRGVLRHKTYGHLPWRNQSVTAGFWDRPAQQMAVDVRDSVVLAVEQTARNIEAQL